MLHFSFVSGQTGWGGHLRAAELQQVLVLGAAACFEIKEEEMEMGNPRCGGAPGASTSLLERGSPKCTHAQYPHEEGIPGG